MSGRPKNEQMCSMPSMMIGVNVKPDVQFFDSDMVKTVNDLFTQIQVTACRFAPDMLTDDKMDAMFDQMGVPRTAATSCRDLLEVAYTAFENSKATDPSYLVPIGESALKFVAKVLERECIDDKITRSTLKASAKARVRVLCNYDQ